MANNTLTQLNQLQIAFKKLLGKTHTSPNFEWFNETLPSSIQLSSDYIFGQSIPSLTEVPSNYTITQNSLGQNVVETVTFTLEEIATSQYDASHTSVIGGTTIDQQAEDSENTSQVHAYKLVLSSDYTTLSSNPNEGSDPFTNSKVVADTTGALQIIPETFGLGYRPIVNDSTGTSLSILGEENWILDPYIGVLWVQDRGGTLKTPASVTASIYIGDFVTDALGNAGDTVDLHFSASEGGGFSFANAATASFESGSAGITVTATPASNKITIGANTDNVNFNHISASGDIALTSTSKITSTADNFDPIGNITLGAIDIKSLTGNTVPSNALSGSGLIIGGGVTSTVAPLIQLGTHYIYGGKSLGQAYYDGVNIFISGSPQQGNKGLSLFTPGTLAYNPFANIAYNDFYIKGTDDSDIGLSRTALELTNTAFNIYSGSGTSTVFNVSRGTKAATFAGEVTATGGFVGDLEGTASFAEKVSISSVANTTNRPILVSYNSTPDGKVAYNNGAYKFTFNTFVGLLKIDGDSGNDLNIYSHSFEGGGSITTFNLLNNNTTTINFGGDATNINMGKANGTVNIAGSASIAGDLIVQGAVTSINTTELNVEDQFILLNSGSNTLQDGGIIVSSGPNNSGSAFYYDADSNRWALTPKNTTLWNVTSETPRQYVVSVSASAAAPSGTPLDFGDSNEYYGMMYVDTSTEDIYIYS